MSLIHPAFDAEARKWFHDHVEAPTIAALLKKLGPGHKVRDFYRGECPRSVTAFDPVAAADYAKIEAENPPLRNLPEKAATGPLPEPKSVAPPPRHGTGVEGIALPPEFRSMSLRDKVLTLWERGVAGPAIADVVGCHRGAISRMVSRYRDDGDPRAVIRIPSRIGKPKKKAETT